MRFCNLLRGERFLYENELLLHDEAVRQAINAHDGILGPYANRFYHVAASGGTRKQIKITYYDKEWNEIF